MYVFLLGIYGDKHVNIIQAVKYVLKDEERKPLPQIGIELLHCAFIEREIPFYYFTSLLYQKNSGDYRKFIGHRKIRRIDQEFFHKGGDHSVLENKYAFDRLVTQYGIPTPRLIARTCNRTISFTEGDVYVQDIAGLAQAIHHAISLSEADSVFVKPLEGIGGQSSFKLSKSSSPDDITTIFESMETTDFIFQETLVQHECIDAIYDGSINTLRILAYVTPGSHKIEIITAYMRFGAGGSVVDNTAAQGLRVPVDLETWRLKGPGKSSLRAGAGTFVQHPDSGQSLDGYQLPFESETIHLVETIAPLFDKSFVGWDIALTEQGPVVIEGNQNPHLIGAQSACGGVRNDRVFMEVLNDYL